MGVVRDKLDYLSGTKRLLREGINAVLADRGDPLLTESTPFEDYPSALWAQSTAASAGSLAGAAADKLLRLNETKSRLREAINAELGIGLTVDDPFRFYGESIWTPRALFLQGEQGAWYDPSDLTTLYQDSAGTTPVTADGDPVGLMLDKSGNGNHASQSVASARPIYRTDGTLRWLKFDGVDDRLEFFIPFNLFEAGLSYCLGYDTNGAPRGVFYAKHDGVVPWAFAFDQVSPAGTLIDVSASSEPTLSLRVDGVDSGPATRDKVYDAVAGKHVQIWNAAGASGNYQSSSGHGFGLYSDSRFTLSGMLFGLIWRETLLGPETKNAEQYLANKSGVQL
jgi:hypothetical protein